MARKKGETYLESPHEQLLVIVPIIFLVVTPHVTDV
jgi:hypothetical protein